MISSTPCDIDADGMDEAIEIAIVDGRRYEWPAPYCGDGERWEGNFEIRTVDGRSVLAAASLNELMGEDSLFFWAPQFEVELSDYNGDDLVDFNLMSSEGGCNGNGYRLFAIDREGRVRMLSQREFYAAPPHCNSTAAIASEDGLLRVVSYSQETGTNVVDWYAWQGDDCVFVRRDVSSSSY